MHRLAIAALLVSVPSCAKDSPPGATKADASKAAKVVSGKAPHGKAGKGHPPMKQEPPSEPRELEPSGGVKPITLQGLILAVPAEWDTREVRSKMRVAQWDLPGPGGGAELVVYRFEGQGGAVDANIARWKGQIQRPEGAPEAPPEKIEGDGITTTLIDLTGTFVAAVRPGAKQRHNKPNSRMMAAIVEGIGNPFYFKVVGPEATVKLWADPFRAMIKTFAKDG